MDTTNEEEQTQGRDTDEYEESGESCVDGGHWKRKWLVNDSPTGHATTFWVLTKISKSKLTATFVAWFPEW